MTYIHPEEVKSSKKQRKVDMEVLDLKQKLNGAHSKQVVLSNREIRLLRYVLKTISVRYCNCNIFSLHTSQTCILLFIMLLDRDSLPFIFLLIHGMSLL